LIAKSLHLISGFSFTGSEITAVVGNEVTGVAVKKTCFTGTGTSATGVGVGLMIGAKVVGDGVGDFVDPGGCVLFQNGSLGSSTSLIKPACSDSHSGVGSWFRNS
jgi:hypothetical protein